MSLAYLSPQISVTTGQTFAVPGASAGGWVPVFAASLPGSRNHISARLLLVNDDSTHAATMIIEAAEELDGGGNALSSEIIEEGADITAAPGTKRTYIIEHCKHRYLRISASGAGGAATLARGGIEVIQ